MRVRDENKEASIREKAIEMIVKNGFDGLSMQKLAKAANVSPATIYIYYKNREDLLDNLYNYVHKTLANVALKKFDPELPLKEGLLLQWKNRLRFITEYPMYYRFFEQFRSSPCINNKGIDRSDFKENMKQFALNAMKRGELAKMEPEMFWAIAYGPFYSMVRFHLEEKSMMGNTFRITDAKLKHTLKMVLQALKTKA